MKNDITFYASLVFLFAGIWLKFDLGTALIVLGSAVSALHVATAFFITGLSAKLPTKSSK